MAKLTQQQWSIVFDHLPRILPNMELSRVNEKYISPRKIGGDQPKEPKQDKTNIFDNGDNIQLYEWGEDKGISLVDTLIKFYGCTGFPDAMDTIKRIAGIEDSFSSKQERSLLDGSDFGATANSSLDAGREEPLNEEEREPFSFVKGEEPLPVICPPLHKGVYNIRAGLHGQSKEYIEARGLYYSNNWGLLQNVMTATMNRKNDSGRWEKEDIILMRWTAPNGEKAGLYNINPTTVLRDAIGLYTGEKYKVYTRTDKDGKKIETGTFKRFFSGNGAGQTNSTGGAVRTASPKNGVIGICEGLEDALSIMQITGYFMQEVGATTEQIEDERKRFLMDGGTYEAYPVWACCGKGGLSAFIPPEGLTKLYIFPDMKNGKPEQEAFEKAEQIQRDFKIECEVVPVPVIYGDQPKDWNEYLQTMNYYNRLTEE